jgi:hypothetical protein
MGSDPAKSFFGGVLLHVIEDVMRAASTEGQQIIAGYSAIPH